MNETIINGIIEESQEVAGQLQYARGPKGDSGVGISDISKTSTEGKVDTYTITLTDGTTKNFTVTNGDDGANGISVSDASINASGHLIVTLSNGTTIDAGVAKAEIANFDFIKIVTELPETGLINRTYFVPKSDPTTNDLYDEYMWVDGKWELITTKQIEVDLTGYVKREDVDDALSFTSDNPVKNKIIAKTLNDILNHTYITEDVVGIQVDYQNKVFKRLAGAQSLSTGEDFNSFHAFGGRRRCNVADDGTILAYYGDANYKDDGSNGQVMVYQPAFYYRVVPLIFDRNTTTGIGYHLRKANYYISDVPYLGFRLHPAFYDENGNEVEYVLMSAYEGSMYDVSSSEYVNDATNTSTAIEAGDLLCSVAGVKPISGLKKTLTRSNTEIMASNRGSGWHLETIKITSANQLLMMVELGTMNTQTAIGQGVVSIAYTGAYNASSYTGSTSSLGNTTGQATETINEISGTETAYTTPGMLSITYRGVENPWGNIWKYIQGINIYGDGTVGGGQPYVANNFVFSESKIGDNYEPVGFTLPNINGYVNAMGYGSKEFDWLLMPSEVGGTSALPVGDYCYVTSNLSGYRVARLGGSWYANADAGGFRWDCNSGVDDRNRNIGGRLSYTPTGKSTTIKS